MMKTIMLLLGDILHYYKYASYTYCSSEFDRSSEWLDWYTYATDSERLINDDRVFWGFVSGARGSVLVGNV